MGDSAKEHFHLSLRVGNLNRSVEFYGRLFGKAPAKFFHDYAKFELENPPVVLSLEPSKPGDRLGLDHLGIRLEDRNSLIKASSEIAARGLSYEHLQGVTCCYSRQSKIFLNDPDGHLVEVYTVDADIADAEHTTARTSVTCAPVVDNDAYEHLLPTAFPQALPVADNTLKEIQLRGTFNAKMNNQEAHRIVTECYRALQKNGSISTHILVADKPLQGEVPRLPEPASHVERVPTEQEMISLFEEAGFVGLTLRRFSHSSVFSFGGSEFREFLLTAVKPILEGSAKAASTSTAEQVVMYKGPFPSVTDESGVRFERGRRTFVKATTAELIRSSPYADSFVFLNVDAGKGCG